MQKLRILFISSALFVAFAILGVSLTSVSLVQSAGTGLAAGDKELYFEGEMLPDHIGYPVLMAVDRIRLESAPRLERVYMRTEYANRRLNYAQKLLEKDKPELALATMTKAQKYILAASQEILHNELPPNAEQHVYKTLQYHIDAVQSLEDDFTPAQMAVLQRLNEECRVVAEQLSHNQEA